MRRRRTGLLLAAVGAAATLSLSAAPALAAGQGDDRGATIEEFICLRETGQEVRLGTGKVITTPSGNMHVACTAAPPSSL